MCSWILLVGLELSRRLLFRALELKSIEDTPTGATRLSISSCFEEITNHVNTPATCMLCNVDYATEQSAPHADCIAGQGKRFGRDTDSWRFRITQCSLGLRTGLPAERFADCSIISVRGVSDRAAPRYARGIGATVEEPKHASTSLWPQIEPRMLGHTTT